MFFSSWLIKISDLIMTSYNMKQVVNKISIPTWMDLLGLRRSRNLRAMNSWNSNLSDWKVWTMLKKVSAASPSPFNCRMQLSIVWPVMRTTLEGNPEAPEVGLGWRNTWSRRTRADQLFWRSFIWSSTCNKETVLIFRIT